MEHPYGLVSCSLLARQHLCTYVCIGTAIITYRTESMHVGRILPISRHSNTISFCAPSQ